MSRLMNALRLRSSPRPDQANDRLPPASPAKDATAEESTAVPLVTCGPPSPEATVVEAFMGGPPAQALAFPTPRRPAHDRPVESGRRNPFGREAVMRAIVPVREQRRKPVRSRAPVRKDAFVTEIFVQSSSNQVVPRRYQSAAAF